MNQHATYQGQRSFSSEVILRPDTRTHRSDCSTRRPRRTASVATIEHKELIPSRKTDWRRPIMRGSSSSAVANPPIDHDIVSRRRSPVFSIRSRTITIMTAPCYLGGGVCDQRTTAAVGGKRPRDEPVRAMTSQRLQQLLHSSLAPSIASEHQRCDVTVSAIKAVSKHRLLLLSLLLSTPSGKF